MTANGCCSWGALKLSTGETRPSVGDSMEDACSPSSSSPLHCLSTASGKCILRASVCTCFVLDCWLHGAEILPRYLFLSGMLKNTAVFPHLHVTFHGWWLPATFEWWSPRPGSLVGFQKQLWGQPAGSYLTFALEGCTRSVSCIRPFPFPPVLQPWGYCAVFSESFCHQTLVGVWKKICLQISKC